MAENVLLEMRGITKTFPGVKALDNVCLEVQAGHIHALVGENGAGKIDADERAERHLPLRQLYRRYLL